LTDFDVLVVNPVILPAQFQFPFLRKPWESVTNVTFAMEILVAQNTVAQVPCRSFLEKKLKRQWRRNLMSDDELTLYPWRKKVKTLPESFRNPIENIIRVGHIPKLVATREKVRETLGINRKPPTAYQHENAREELKELVKGTELYDKATWNVRKDITEDEGK
jgi:hypothetical protein